MNIAPTARFLCSLCLCFAFFGCGGGTGSNSGGGGNGGGGGTGGNQVTTVAIVMLENTSYENVIGSASMPFLNSLVPQGALATQYFGNTHPSIGNYFMLTAGDPTISNDDNFVGSVSNDNIVRHLLSAGKTWKGYYQSIPSAGYTGIDRYPYIKHHNPFSYFTDVTDSTAQTANIVPLDQLAADEAANAFPNFMFIMPDNVHNLHDCPGGFTVTCPAADRLAAADAFLSATVPPLLNNATFKQNGLLIIMCDEGNLSDFRNAGGHVPVLALGSHAKVGFQSTTFYQHQNMLRTITDLLGATAPGAGATATSMSEMLQ